MTFARALAALARFGLRFFLRGLGRAILFARRSVFPLRSAFARRGVFPLHGAFARRRVFARRGGRIFRGRPGLCGCILLKGASLCPGICRFLHCPGRRPGFRRRGLLDSLRGHSRPFGLFFGRLALPARLRPLRGGRGQPRLFGRGHCRAPGLFGGLLRCLQHGGGSFFLLCCRRRALAAVACLAPALLCPGCSTALFFIFPPRSMGRGIFARLFGRLFLRFLLGLRALRGVLF